MLRILREHATSWMLRGILILVAVTFISWGGYSLIREKKVTYAAKVNGVVIEMRDYQESFQGAIKQYRDALGASFSEKMIEELHLREKVLDELISRILVLQEGTKLGLSTSDEELRGIIESIPSFQVNGQFDRRLYERFLRINRMTPEEFERTQRESYLIAKAINLIKMNGGMVSEEELLETFLFENERINLTFLRITPESFKGQVDVNELEMKDYYQKNQETFRIPVSLQVQYLIFRAADFEGKIQISSDEIKRQYDLKKDQFKTPKQVKAKEILIKVGAEDPSNKIEEKKKRVDDLLEKAKKTKDFGSLAKQYSDSNTASKGGDLGWVQKGTLDEAVEEGLFLMKAGEVKEIRAKDGFHILKVEEIKEGKEKSFEEAKDQILQTLKKEKAKKEASRMADDAFYSLFRSREIAKYAEEKNIPIKTTGFFKEGDEIPGIGKNSSFHASAHSLKVGEISPVVNISSDFYILKLVDKKESAIPPLEQVKEEVKRKVAETKCEEKARQVAGDLLVQVRAGKGIKEIGRERGLQVEETGFFTRSGGTIPKIGPTGEYIGVLASLTEKNPIPKEVLRTKEGYFVLRLLGLEPADQSKFSSIKETLQKRLIYQKGEEFYRTWIQQLKAKGKIEINKAIL